jgi:hypothetical protein
MAILPNQTELLGMIRPIQFAEQLSSANLNRPVFDLIAALAGVNGVFSDIETVMAFSTIHKPSHVLNETRLLVHFDDGFAPSVGDVIPSLPITTTALTNNLVLSKFFGCMDMGGQASANLGPEVDAGDNVVYDELTTSYSAGHYEGTISLWVRPYSSTVGGWTNGFKVYSYFADIATALVPFVDTKDSPSSTTQYIEIGFNSEFEYFYAKFVGTGGVGGTITLANLATSFPVGSEFTDKWYNLVVTWEMDNTAVDSADHIFETNLYVDGDLIAANEPVGSPGRFVEVMVPPGALDTIKINLKTQHYLIDELRYDSLITPDEEVFSWYQSDVPFAHNNPVIHPNEFGHSNLDQMIKTILSGGGSGNIRLNYVYYPPNTTIGSTDVSGFMKQVELGAVPGFPAWVALCTFTYDGSGFLANEEFIIPANGNGTHVVTVTISTRYNTPFYLGNRFNTKQLGDLAGIGLFDIDGTTPLYDNVTEALGFMQDNEVITFFT